MSNLKAKYIGQPLKCNLCGNPDLPDSHMPYCDKYTGGVVDWGVRERQPDGKVF